MSSTSVHSGNPKVTYGIIYASDKTNESLKMPPEQSKEGKKERDPLYKIDTIRAEKNYTDRESHTRVDSKRKVLTGDVKIAKKMIEGIESNER